MRIRAVLLTLGLTCALVAPSSVASAQAPVIRASGSHVPATANSAGYVVKFSVVGKGGNLTCAGTSDQIAAGHCQSPVTYGRWRVYRSGGHKLVSLSLPKSANARLGHTIAIYRTASGRTYSVYHGAQRTYRYYLPRHRVNGRMVAKAHVIEIDAVVKPAGLFDHLVVSPSNPDNPSHYEIEMFTNRHGGLVFCSATTEDIQHGECWSAAAYGKWSMSHRDHRRYQATLHYPAGATMLETWAVYVDSHQRTYHTNVSFTKTVYAYHRRAHYENGRYIPATHIKYVIADMATFTVTI